MFQSVCIWQRNVLKAWIIPSRNWAVVQMDIWIKHHLGLSIVSELGTIRQETLENKGRRAIVESAPYLQVFWKYMASIAVSRLLEICSSIQNWLWLLQISLPCSVLHCSLPSAAQRVSRYVVQDYVFIIPCQPVGIYGISKQQTEIFKTKGAFPY